MPNLKEIGFIFDITPADQAILLVAIHGVGKSEFIKSHWEAKGYRVIIKFASQMADAGDLIGLPTRVEKDGIVMTTFAQPDWWPKDNEKVVIFLDEVNRSKPEVIQCLQDMVLNRELNGRKLPPETRIIAAINPFGDDFDYDVQELEASFSDRFNTYQFKPTVEELIDYATKCKWNKMVIGFLYKHAKLFLDPPLHRKNTNEVYPSRRSWERVSHILNSNPNLLEDTRNNKLIITIEGIVGAGATSSFVQYIKDSTKGLNPSKIIISWDSKTESIVKTMANQEIAMLNSEIAGYLEENETDIFEVGARNKATYASNLAKYFKVIPKELVADFYGHATNSHSKGKTWAKKFLDLDDKILVDLFIDIINGESDHDKHVKNILKDGDTPNWK